MNGIYIFILPLAFLGSFITFSEQQVPGQQFIRIMPSSACTGTPIFNSTLEKFNHTTTASVLYINVEGIWILNHCNATACGKRTVLSGTGVGCATDSTVLGMTNLQFTRLGHEFQTAQELHLFTNASFDGDRYVVNSNGASYPTPIPIRSWFYSGANNWTTFALSNYQGVESCRPAAAPVVSRGFGFTVNFNSNINVGSVKPNCGGGTTPTTTTTSTTTSTTRGVTTTTTTATTTTTIRPNTTTTRTTSTTTGASMIEKSVFLMVAIFLVNIMGFCINS